MSACESTVTARATVAGLHHWPDAPDRRAYLRHPHRHLFVVTAEVQVTHDERQVEFHDLCDLLARAMRDLGQPYHRDTDLLNFGASSCERLAGGVMDVLCQHGLNPIRVTVSEDGENDSTRRPA